MIMSIWIQKNKQYNLTQIKDKKGARNPEVYLLYVYLRPLNIAT